MADPDRGEVIPAAGDDAAGVGEDAQAPDPPIAPAGDEPPGDDWVPL